MSKKNQPVHPVRPTFGGWKGDMLTVFLMIALVIILMKGCNVFFPGDSEEAPVSLEESQ